MTNNDLTIEIFQNGQWQAAAELSISANPDDYAGQQRPSALSYDIDYALPRLDADRVVDRTGCRYPVNFDRYDEPGWPSFLLDLLPTSPARTAWLKRLNLTADDPSAWWQLLINAAACPVGNLRIAPTPQAEEAHFNQRGFSREEIIAHHDDFCEYAAQCGADVAGAFDLQGKSPKLLLVQDHHGHWHGEGALADDQIHSHWLVKFPRSNSKVDRQILANEAAYYETARAFGLHTAPYPLDYHNDRDGALFIQRFDRQVTSQGVERFGMESLASICGLNAFDQPLSHNQACQAIYRYTTNPPQEVLEYITRDILNTALRNSDNHPRNTALLKHPNGSVALSPLFDFAPMFLDPQGISRAMRWHGDGEKMLGLPVWGQIAIDLEQQIDLPSSDLRHWLAGLAKNTERLPDTLQHCQVSTDIIDKLIGRIRATTRVLRDAKPHI